MAQYSRKRRSLKVPITLSVSLMVINITLMVCWIVLLAQLNAWSPLTIGTVAFALMLVGLILYLVFSIKEVRLHQRQANFIDSVTHELKTPIASLKLYLETLQMRSVDEKQQAEFYSVMNSELLRLDQLINQLLEVARLDAIGEHDESEDIELEPLLMNCAKTACAHHKDIPIEVFQFDMDAAVVPATPMLLEMIFVNLLDNAIKYGADDPKVEVQVRIKDRNRVVTRITDNGDGVPSAMRKKVFQMFYRGGSELERKQKGTGIGLYVVRTLVLLLKGKVSVHERLEGTGSIFEVELPGRAAVCES